VDIEGLVAAAASIVGRSVNAPLLEGCVCGKGADEDARPGQRDDAGDVADEHENRKDRDRERRGL
jgi:hypothetical protein